MRTLYALLLVMLFVVTVVTNIMAFVVIIPVVLVLGFWKIRKDNKRFEEQHRIAKENL